MKWALTLHGGENHGKTIILDAENSDEARRRAIEEMKRKNAKIFELEKIE